jgi:hypothetical protein
MMLAARLHRLLGIEILEMPLEDVGRWDTGNARNVARRHRTGTLEMLEMLLDAYIRFCTLMDAAGRSKRPQRHQLWRRCRRWRRS